MKASMLHRPLSELAKSVQTGELLAEDLTQLALERCDARSDLGAFLHVAKQSAMQQARAIDQRRAQGESLGPLAGIPIAIKDALCTKDQPTTAASRVLRNQAGEPWVPPYDATAIAKLRHCDAVLIGKCNMDEFAMGSSNENSAFFAAKNPWDTSRVPGGSSGGSAVAVSAGMAAASLGSDTGGSVRQPASFTHCVAIKPSYGRVSRFGLIAFASSLDQIGPFANDVRSAALMLECIAGHDPRDATSLKQPAPNLLAACEGDVRGLRVGVPEEYFSEGLDIEVEERVRAALDAFAQLGASIVPIQLPHTRYAVATYYVLATAECSSNLSRFDGVRFGYRSEDPGNIEALYRTSRGQGFGAEVKRRIMLGTYVLSAGYYDAYYLQAQKARTVIRQDFSRAFAEVDLIATPVSPTVAFPLGQRIEDPLSMYLADAYTLPASLAGLAAISVPYGFAKESKLPVGVQLIAPSMSEDVLVRAAAQLEATNPDREARPSFPAAP